jgi:hypothetical protein
MFDRLLSDPVRACYLPIVLFAGFSFVMWRVLSNEDSNHDWWGHLMTSLKLAGDEESAVDSGRVWFKWFTVLGALLLIANTGRMVWREHPLRSQAQISGESHPDLPRGYGAGGSGVIVPGKKEVPKDLMAPPKDKPSDDQDDQKSKLPSRNTDIREDN